MSCNICDYGSGLMVVDSEDIEDGIKEKYECSFCGGTGWYESDGINHTMTGILSSA